ncbi:MAG: transposase [bacterium]
MYGYWHTYNRGVEKRNVFLGEADCFRGVHDLYEFNDVNIVVNLDRRLRVGKNEGNRIPLNKPRELLVDLYVWCLMDNHYHLFSSPKEKDNLAKFHQKFGVGYTNYFNLKNKRSGVLFQGKYKKVEVKNDAQLGHLICYIHSNPLNLWKPDWKERGLTDLEIRDAIEFLIDKKNRWSSHQDYWGIKNFPSLINTDFLFNFYGGPGGYRKFFVDWLQQYKKNLNLFSDVKID